MRIFRSGIQRSPTVVVGISLACFSAAHAASPHSQTNNQKPSAAERLVRPFQFSNSVQSDSAGLSLAPDAFQDLKSGPAHRRFLIPRGEGTEFELELSRFSVTAPQTRFLAAGPMGQFETAAPDIVAFRGQLVGKPGSHAFVSIASNGMVNGYVTQATGERYFLGTPANNVAAGGNVVLSRETASPGMFSDAVSCGVTEAHDRRMVHDGAVARGGVGGRFPRLLYVAIDADQQFYNLFGDLTAAQTYIAQVIAAVSDIYIRDFDVKLVLTFSRVWPNGGEPFTAQDLDSFANHWSFNEDPAPYHLIHLMSGRRDTSYGGVAFVAGSCSGGAYGISAFLLGNFPTPVGPSDLWNWDVVVVAHEMGHNMGTFHTHDGYNPPIDQCANGIWARGEIMSYCHTVAGGLLNTDLRFTSRVQGVIRADLELNNCQFYDCNDNGINDAVDVSNANSPDTNGNQIPDECEDCNSNGTLDPAEISGGAPDQNGNGIPDACEADCNGNGRPDTYDISDFLTPDENLNLVPDSCEPDCDDDNISDYVEIRNSSGTLDFDRNGVPDACQDCNANTVFDWNDMLRPGNIFIADQGADVVREFHAVSAAAMTSHSAGPMLNPYDVTFGSDRMAYVANNGDHRILKINPESASVTTFVAAGSGGLNGPSGLTFGPNGNLYVSSLNTNSVLEYTANGAFVRVFVSAGSGGLATPYGIEFGPNGNLFVAGGNRVNQYDGTTGSFIGNFVAPGAGGLNNARGIAFLPDGRLLVVSRSSNQVLEYDSNGASLGQFNDEYPLGGLWGIRVGPNGNVFIVRVSNGVRVIEYDVSNGRYLRSFVRGDAVLNQPTGLAFRSPSPVDCNNNLALDICDIADGLEEDANGNSIPDACESACTPSAPVAPEPGGIAKNRYLSFDLSGAGTVRAIQVILADLPPPFEAFEGQVRWVGPAEDRPEGPVGATFKASRLQCDPHYSDWSGVGVLAVYDDAIVPNGTYEIRVLSDTCDPQEQSSYSVPLALITTPTWADVVPPFTPPSGTVQPDFTDVSAVVDKFRNAPSAPSMAQADVNPNLPDQNLNFSDVSDVVDAFRNLPYPGTGPVACP